MIDRRLSRAVVVYIWGEPRSKPYPSEHPDDVAAAFGADASDLLPYVRNLLAEAYEEPMVLPGEDLSTSADRVEATIRSRHPELDDKALRAIGNHFAFSTK